MNTPFRSWPVRLGLALAVVHAGCNEPPSLPAVSNQEASVGIQLGFEVVAADANGDTLGWRLSSDTLTDLATRTAPATLTSFEPQAAYFRWTPLTSDLGTHEIVLIANDGVNDTELSFLVTVTSGEAAPIFREPLGSGTTLDLRETDCVSVRVVVQDGDGADVSLTLEEPVEEGFTFDQDQPMAATFGFCPSDRQIEAAERYAVTFLAEDRDGHVARKKYLIVLRKDLLSGCPGDGPVISHNPVGTVSSVQDLLVEATVSDDIGVEGVPVLYFSTDKPADPANPVFANFTQVDMNRMGGNAQSGTYSGAIPNPVLSEAVGTVLPVYYFIEAADNDDAAGPCDHRSTAPEDDVFQLDVERPSSGQGLSACETCSADVQCDSGRCIATGNGEVQCLDACSGPGAACPTGFTCSEVARASVNSAIGNVCLPDGGSCQPDCAEDAFEDNDALNDPGVVDLAAGSYPDLSICPNGAGGVDEDFYGVLVANPTAVSAVLSFSHGDGDLDLQLLDDNGAGLASSTGLSDTESVEQCLVPGLYFLRVYSDFSDVSAPYGLDLFLPSGGCCAPDVQEPDDNAFTSMPVVSGDSFFDRSLCPDNEDWYEIQLAAGDTLGVDLLFDQSGVEQDLDIHFYDAGGSDLNPCPPCDINNGQSGSADEYFEYTVGTSGYYYVVVKGFESASAEYAIGFDVF